MTKFVIVCLVPMAAISSASQVPKPYQDVLRTLGRTGSYANGALWIDVERRDLQVSIAGVRAPAAFGLRGSLGIEGPGNERILTGDLVLEEREVNPVISAMLDNGLAIVSLHHQFLFDNPRMFRLRVKASGSAQDLARRIKPALDLLGHVPPEAGLSHGGFFPDRREGHSFFQGNLDTGKIARILGMRLEQQGSVYTVRAPRASASFTGSDQHAFIEGEIGVRNQELRPVLQALRGDAIDIVAIYRQPPNAVVVRYLGRGPAERLANGFKEALGRLETGEAAPKSARR